MLHVSAKTLRRWEERGILMPQRSEGGHRRYSRTQVERLRRRLEARTKELDILAESQVPQVTAPQVSAPRAEVQAAPVAPQPAVTAAPVAPVQPVEAPVKPPEVFKPREIVSSQLSFSSGFKLKVQPEKPQESVYHKWSTSYQPPKPTSYVQAGYPQEVAPVKSVQSPKIDSVPRTPVVPITRVEEKVASYSHQVKPAAAPLVRPFTTGQEKFVRRYSRISLAIIILLLLAKTLPALSSTSARFLESQPLTAATFSRVKQTLAFLPFRSFRTELAEANTGGKVLADVTALTDITFQVNVPSTFTKVAEFLDNVSVAGSATVSGNLAVGGNAAVSGNASIAGNTLSSSSTTFNLLNTVVQTLNLGGAAGTVNIGSATGTIIANNDLTVTGDLQAGDITEIKGVSYSFPSTQGSGDTVLKNDGSGNLTWGTLTQVSSFSDLSGSASVSQGGTGNTTALTAGSIVFSDGSKYTQDNSNFFWDDTNNRLGIGTNSPAAALSVGAGSLFRVNSAGAITAVTGITSSGDLNLTSGNVTIASLNTAGGVVVTDGNGTFSSVGTASTGLCLVSNGTSSPSWGSCSGASTTNTWQVNAGVIAPTNTTLDLAIGGTSTASATFHVNATNGNVTAGGTITGTTLNGTTGINTGAGAGTQRIDSSGNLTNIGNINASGNITFSTFTTANGILYTNGSGVVAQTAQGASGTVLKGNGASAPTWGSVALTTDVSGLLPIANGGTNTNATPTAGAVAYGTGSAYAFTTQGTSGQCLVSAGSGAPTWSNCAEVSGTQWTLSNGAVLANNPTVDVLIGGYATASSKIAFININSGTPTASISATGGVATYITGAGTLQTTLNTPLTIGGNSTGNITLSPLNGSGTVTVNGNLLATGNIVFSGLTANRFVKTGAGGALTTAQYVNLTSEVTGTLPIANGGTNSTATPTAGGLAYGDGTGYAFTSVGSIGQCIVSGGSGAPTWSDCGTAASRWDISNGMIYPKNSTLDFALGGTATTSAKFAVLNINSGTPTASLSAGEAGGTYLTANGTLQTTASQTLTIGGSTTGNIALNPMNGGGTVTVNGSVVSTSTIRGTTLNGTTGINTGAGGGTQRIDSSGNLTNIGSINASGTVTFSSLNTPGGVVYTNGSGQLATVAGTSGQCLVSAGSSAPVWTDCAGAAGDDWSIASGALYANNTTVDFLLGGTSTASARAAFLNINSGTPTASLSAGATGGAYLTAAGELQTTARQNLTIGGSTTGDIYLMPVSGNGKVGIGTNTPLYKLDISGGQSGLRVTSNTHLDSVLQAGASSQAYQIFQQGSTQKFIAGIDTSGNFKIRNQNTSSDSIFINSTTNNVGIGGDTTPDSLFSVGSSSEFQVNSSGAIAAATGITSSGTITFSGLTANRFVKTTTGGQLTTSQYIDLTTEVTGTLPIANGGTNSTATPTAGGIAYGDGSAYQFTAAGTSGQCLVSNGSSAPSWTSCSGAAGDDWTLANGTYYPNNSTADLLIGGTSSTSAKFAFLNVNSGTPTASISAGASGATYLTAGGVLQTTAFQPLTIGGTTTGQIGINNRSGSTFATFDTVNSRLGIGTTTPTAKLTVDGTTANFLNSSAGAFILTVQGGEGNSGSLEIKADDGDNSTDITTLVQADGGPFSIRTTNGTVEALTILANGNLGVGGDTTPDSLFNVGNTSQFQVNSSGAIAAATGITSSGTITFSGLGTGIVHANSSGVLSSSAVNLASADVTGVLPIANGGTNSTATPTAGGIAYGDGSAYQFTAAGTSGQCLLSAGTGTPTWGSCETASGNDWSIANGAIYTNNSTVDFLLGGSATSSARAAFLNINSGTPTASLSAGTAGGAYLTATGNLQTTAFQPLTIGGMTTGQIGVNNRSGSTFATFDTVNSRLGIGTTTPGSKVDISAGTLTAANNYILNLSGTAQAATNLSTGLNLSFAGNNSGTSNINQYGALFDLTAGYSGDSQAAAVFGRAAANAGTGSQFFNTGRSSIGVLGQSTGSTTNMGIAGTAQGGSVMNVGALGSALSGTSARNIGVTGLALNGTTYNVGGYFALTGAAVSPSISSGALVANNGSTTSNIFQALDNDTAVFTIIDGGNVGIGDTSPAAALTVGSGDLFQVNSSGQIAAAAGITSSGTITFSGLTANRFVKTTTGGQLTTSQYIDLTTEVTGTLPIANGGTNSTATPTAGGVAFGTGTAYAFTSAGTSGQCLVSNGTGAPSWTSCSGAAGVDNQWNQTNAALYPINPTVDVLFGGTATTSAKFAFINVNSGTPTASISAGIDGATYLTAAGLLQTTANQNLTIGGNTTGNVTIKGLNGTGTVTLDGDVTIASSNNFKVTDLSTAGGVTYVNSSGNFAVSAQGTSGQCLVSNGSSAPSWSDCGVAAGSTNYWSITAGAIYPTNPTLDFLLGGSATSSARAAFLNINSGTPTASLSAGIAGGTYLTADGTLQTTASQTLTIGGNTTGNITLSPLNGSGKVTSTGTLNLSSGKTYQINGTDVLSATTLGSGVTSSSLTSVGALASGSIASGFGTISTSNTITGTTLNGTTGINTGAGAGTQRIDSSGNLANIGTINASGQVTFSNLSTGVVHADSSGVLTSSAVVLTSEVSGVLPIANGGTNSTATPTQGGIAYGTGSAYAFTSAGTSGQCLISNGTSAPSWTDCGAASGDDWTLANGAYYPNNPTADLLIGGTASTSAKFAFLNVNSGTPTASISGTAGSTYLTAAGTLQTTASQNLTIGGSTTGNISLMPINGTGRVGIGTTSPVTQFHVNQTAIASTAEDLARFSISDSTAALRILNATNNDSAFVPQIYGQGATTAISLNLTGAIGTDSGTNPAVMINTSTAVSTRPILDVRNASTSKMLITANGNLAVGPSTSVSGTHGQFHVTGAYGNNAAAVIDQTYTGDIIAASASGTTRMRLTNTGELLVGNGSASTPAFSFTGDTNSGMFGTGSDVVGFATGGTEAMRIDSSQNVGIGNTGTLDAKLDLISTTTTGKGIEGTFNSLTTGTGLTLTSTSTGLTTGGLISADWSPGSATTATGDLVSINVGANGTIGNIFNVKNAGSSVFSVGQNQIVANLPTSFTAPGDVSMAYDLQFTNQTSSYIKSNAPLYLEAGEIFESNDLTLRTFNSGNIIVDSQALQARSATLSGQLAVGSLTTAPSSIGGLYLTNGSTYGKALAILNQTESQDIFTASASGTAKFTIASSGNLTATGTITGLTGVTSSGTITFSGLSTGIVHANSSGVLSSSAVNLASADVTGTLPIANGGTNSTATPTQGGIAYGTGTAYAFTAAGTSGQCLISAGTSTPTWGSCDSGSGSSKWFVDGGSGVIYPLNITTDFLLGGTATSSAKFAVLNLNSGTPTASISAGEAGGLYMTAAGTLQTTASQTLTIGGSTTGNITLSPINGSGKVTSTGTLTLASGKTYQINGTDVLSSTTLGSGVTSSSLTTVGALSSGSIASGFGTIATSNTITGTTLNGTTGINTGAGAGTQRIDSSGNVLNINDVTAGGTITFSGLTADRFVKTTTGGQLTTSQYVNLTTEVTGTLPIANGGTNSTATPTAGGIAYGSGTAYAFTAAGNSGECLISAGSGTPTWGSCTTNGSQWNISNGAIFTKNSTVDFLLGGSATTSAKFAVLNINSGTPTASISAGEAGGLYMTAAGTIQSTANQNLTIGGDTTGNITLKPLNGSGTVTVDGALSVTGSILSSSTITGTTINGTTGINTGAGAGTQRIDASGNLVNINNVTIGGTVDISSFTTKNGIVYVSNTTGRLAETGQGASGTVLKGNGDSAPTWGAVSLTTDVSGTLPIANGGTNSTATPTAGGISYGTGTAYAFSSAGTTNDCLVSGGTGAPSWVGCAYWKLSSGTLQTVNNTADLLIGGTATSSAKFAFINVNSGTPTATISGNLSLQVPTGADPAATLNILNGGSLNIQYSPGGDAGLASALYIKNNGNIGVGTTSPTSRLSIAGSTSTISNTSGDITINPASGNVSLNSETLINFAQTLGALGTSSAPTYSFSGDANTGMYSGAADTIRFTTAGTDRLTITSSGLLGVGTTSPAGTLQVTGAYSNNAALIVNQTYSGSVLSASASGTTVFDIGREGDIQIGAATKKDVNVNLYGDINQQGSTELNGITSINDVFIYDTTTDSDYGAWTDSRLSRLLSWYTETKDDGAADNCSVSGDDRCGSSAFPKKATIVAADSGVYIFDANSNKLWMKFTQAGTYALGADSNNNPSSVTAKNGSIYVGMSGSSALGVVEIDFKSDRMFTYDATDRAQADTTIGTRNSTTAYATNSDTRFAITNPVVNDVFVQVIAGKTYIAVANDTAISVINKSDAKVFSYSDVTSDDYNAVWLTSKGSLFATNETQAQLELWKDVHLDTAAEINGTPDKVWDESSTPALSATGATIQTTAGSLFVTENTSTVDGASSTIYVGTSNGLTVINNNYGDESNGAVKYYTKDYITEEMMGDIRGMWSFNESSGSLQDKSLKSNWLEDENAPTYSASGVRGNALTFDGTADHLCSDSNNDGTCDTDSDFDFGTGSFAVATWFKHATGVVGNDTLIDHSYNTTPAAVLGWRIWMNSGQMVFGIDDDATWTSSVPTDDQITSAASPLYNDNQWHHLVAVKEGTAAIRLYIDGELVASDTSLTATGTLTGTGVILGVGADCGTGAACSTGGNFWDGSIDEVTITAEALTPDQIRQMYLTGKQAVGRRTISVTDATAATTTTIADSGEAWTPNEFVGTLVEITGGTGSGQTRTVISNTATTLTVSPAWTTTPDTSSDFAITSQELYGTTNTVKAVAASDQGLGKERLLYVGTNDGSDAGGVSVFDLDADSVVDLYHADAGKTDENSTAWGSTTNYDDITALDTRSGIMAIGAQDQYWMEKESRTLSAELDRLRNELSTVKTAAGSSGLLSNQTQNNTSDTAVGYQVVRKGWGFLLGDNATNGATEAVSYGITFDSPPILLANYLGSLPGSDPSGPEKCTSTNANLSVSGQNTTSTGFTIQVTNTAAAAIANTLRACYSWVAIGTVRSQYSGATSPFAAGADLAEYYATDDSSLKAGEIVSISKAGDIKVVRSEGKYDPTAIGIISTQPATILGDETGLTPGYKETQFSASASAVAVALAGRVPLRVSLENGPIHAGDYLTTSSTPGVAMKMTKAGPTIGRAMENFDGSSTLVALATETAAISAELKSSEASQSAALQQGDAVLNELGEGLGTIMAFVNTSYADPGAIAAQDAATWADLAGISTSTGSAQTFESLLANLVNPTATTSGYFTTEGAGSVRGSLDDLGLAETDISLSLGAVNLSKYLEVGGNAYIGRNLGVQNSLILGSGLTFTDTSIDYMGNVAAEQRNLSILGSGQGSLSILNGALTITDKGEAIIKADLKLGGTIEPDDYNKAVQVKVATVAGEVAGIATDSATATASGGVKQSRFEIVDQDSAPVATISAEGSAEFKGNVQVQGAFQLSDRNVGELVVPAGNKEYTFLFAQPFTGKVFINLTATDGLDNNASVKNVTTSGFTLVLPVPSYQPRTFNWFAIERSQ